VECASLFRRNEGVKKIGQGPRMVGRISLLASQTTRPARGEIFEEPIRKKKTARCLEKKKETRNPTEPKKKKKQQRANLDSPKPRHRVSNQIFPRRRGPPSASTAEERGQKKQNSKSKKKTIPHRKGRWKDLVVQRETKTARTKAFCRQRNGDPIIKKGPKGKK